MKEMKIFENEEINVSVRTILNDDGSISVNAEDTAIGFGWTQEKNGILYIKWERLNGYLSEFGFSPQVGKDDYIPESLFYRLGMKANNHMAERFQNWLAMEVIPSIRKNGGYIAGEDNLSDDELLEKAILVAQRKIAERDKIIAEQKEKIAEQKPLVDFANHVSQTKDTIDMDEMAKIIRDENINIGRNRLIKWLKEKKILKDNRTPYQKYIERGYFDVVEVEKDTNYGTKVFPKTVITGKGQIWITEKLRNEYK